MCYRFELATFLCCFRAFYRRLRLLYAVSALIRFNGSSTDGEKTGPVRLRVYTRSSTETRCLATAFPVMWFRNGLRAVALTPESTVFPGTLKPGLRTPFKIGQI